MSQFRKSNLLAGLIIGLAASAAQAGIILDNGVVVQNGAVPLNNRAMSSILLAPGVGAQPETSYLIQRSLAWQTYRRSKSDTGAMLVYPPAVGGVGSPASIRQLEVRNHLSRANAYRLNYFRK